MLLNNEESPNTTIHYGTFCFCTMASSWSLSYHIEHVCLFIYPHMSIMWMFIRMWKVYSRTKEYCLLTFWFKRNLLMYTHISTMKFYDTLNECVCILFQISVSSNTAIYLHCVNNWQTIHVMNRYLKRKTIFKFSVIFMSYLETILCTSPTAMIR